MESDQDPVEPAHPRRKPRARAPKTQRLEEAPAYKEIAQQDVILDLSSASGVPLRAARPKNLALAVLSGGTAEELRAAARGMRTVVGPRALSRVHSPSSHRHSDGGMPTIGPASACGPRSIRWGEADLGALPTRFEFVERALR